MMKHDNNNHNPWAGLSSYEDPAKSEQKLIFCGRDNETKEVARLIDDNLFVTLYGKSGIGKTSLLNAGVFPTLRREQYTPLSLRLGMTDETSSFQEVITQAIECTIDEIGGSIQVVNVMDEQTDKNATDYLWRWFARRRFLTSKGQITFPVLVFDQFEEVFRNNDSRKKTKVLLEQLNYLIDESNAIGECVVDGEEYSYDFNFRFVVSIREDDLYLLEDTLDNCTLSALKRCRYRLRSLSVQGAREAILIPGGGLFCNEEKDKIAETIIQIASNKEDQRISTNILSLVCNRLYVEMEKSGSASISLSLVDSFAKGNPFERFYNEATHGFSNREKSYIEEHFVDSTGRRNSIPESDFLLHVKNGAKLIEGKNRILQRTSTSSDGKNYRIELIHDSFCEPLSKQKEKREKRKRTIRWLVGFLVAVLIIGGLSLIIHEMKQRETKMLINQSRFIAEKASKLVDQGDSYMAQRILIEVLPKNLEKPNRPYTTEAESAFRTALAHKSAIMRGHTYSVSFASFSPDGKRIVSASNDWTVRIWDAQTGQQIGQPLEGHTNNVNSSSFSPDGKRIVSASNDETVRIWDAQTGRQLGQPLEGHTSVVESASFSPDRKRIVSASRDNTIRIWDAQTGRQIGQPLEGHMNYVHSASFSPDGKRIVSASDDGTVRIWDAQTGRQIGQPLEGHTSYVYSASFSPDGKHIVSASRDNTIRIWDAQTGRQIGQPLEGHTGWVYSASFSPDGKRIVSASWDWTVRIWDSQTGQQIGQPMEGHTNWVNSASFSPDGKRIVSASWDNTIRIWDALTDQQIGQSLEGHTDYVQSASFSPNGKRIVSASNDGTVRIWNALTGRQVGQPLEKHTGYVLSAAFSPDGKRIVSASSDNTIRIWDAQTGRQIGQPLEGHTNDVWSASFSPDGKRIVSASADWTIRIWDAQRGHQIGQPLEGHSADVLSATFSPNGNRIVSASADGSVSIWDSQTGQEIGKPLLGHTGEVFSAYFSPDGKRIVSASSDNTIRIWDAQTGRQIGQPLEGHTSYVHSVSFSPDGKRIVSASWDKTIRIWDAQTGHQIGQPLEGHIDYVQSASFSPDGKRIVSASWDHTIRIWEFPSLQELIDSVRERFKDYPLTPEERKKYYLE